MANFMLKQASPTSVHSFRCPGPDTGTPPDRGVLMGQGGREEEDQRRTEEFHKGTEDRWEPKTEDRGG